MKIEPVAFIWDGAAMIPLERYRGLASRQFREIRGSQHPSEE